MTNLTNLGAEKIKREIRQDIERRLNQKLPSAFFSDTTLVSRDSIVDHLVDYFINKDKEKLNIFLSELETELMRFDNRDGVKYRDDRGNLKHVIVEEIEKIIKEKNKELDEVLESQEQTVETREAIKEGDSRPDAKLYSFLPSKK